MTPRVATGLDRLVSGRFESLRGRTVGLIANPSSVDHRLRHAADLLHAAPGVTLARLFGPEHGIRGDAQDMEGVGASSDPINGLPVVSLYGEGAESLRPGPEDLDGLDCLVFDVQDVGSRYYTFAATMFNCMEAATDAGVGFVVLDRPNPIGGEVVEGPTVRPGFESFVGAHPIPIRHGMTVGELARLYRADRRLDLDLEVVPCGGWSRGMTWAETGLPWVPPSPNMPTPETAIVYPGACLIEGTNLSEGRGTTLPFLLWGAPWLGPASRAIADTLAGWPGALLRPSAFRPMFHKHAGRTCFGVHPVVTDPGSFSGLRLYLTMLALAIRADRGRFAWRTEPYEFVADPIAIDLLFGSDRGRIELERAADDRAFDPLGWASEVTATWAVDEQEFRDRRRDSLIPRDEA